MKKSPFHLHLKPQELSAFINFIPLFSLASVPSQRKVARELLGYTSQTRFLFDYPTYSHLRDSYYILLFLVMTHDDGSTKDVNKIVKRMRFKNEEIEKNIKSYFNIEDDIEVLSVEQLEDMWNLESPEQ
tara:strand:+ start:816 stop:1202 length:387 start_codon:yes stop_codon:yes gene_type:complete